MRATAAVGVLLTFALAWLAHDHSLHERLHAHPAEAAHAGCGAGAQGHACSGHGGAPLHEDEPAGSCDEGCVVRLFAAGAVELVEAPALLGRDGTLVGEAPGVGAGEPPAREFGRHAPVRGPPEG